MYNTILRRFPADDFKFFDDNQHLFTATIFVLVSAIQKLARVTQNPPNLLLYRGLGGTAALPESFSVRDSLGCTGFTEWGVMSATSQRDVAISYSGVNEKKPVPIVLEIRVGAVDRGASIKDFSQYPQEKEFVFVPCSFLEQDGFPRLEVTVAGVVMCIPVRVSANLKSATIDDYRKQQKKMHLSAFRYLIDEVEHALLEQKMMERVISRLAMDSTRGSHTPDAIVKRIIKQCTTVLARHQGTSSVDFNNALKYRKLILEMVDVRMMAMSKVEEWLENTSSSYIKYRLDAELRTVHRRRLTFLTQQFSSETSGPRKEKLALDLCKAKGLVIDSISEKNDLGESQLMAAAAEGRSASDLYLLAAAKADVSASREDGVCAMWLAAQFGNLHCIDVLVELGASVNQASKDDTTPLSIAAQMGNLQCVEKLLELGADILKKNRNDQSPIDQARMNSHTEVLCKLEKAASLCTSETRPVNSNDLRSNLIICEPEKSSAQLIISTGDVSDVDGLFALAEYCKTGADVIFIMNYPAYLGLSQSDVDPNYADTNPGLGYKYSLEDVLNNDKDPDKWPLGYAELRESYGGLSSNDQMKAALTDLAFEIVSRIWREGPADKGRLYFCVGGINSINPFSASAIKNELFVYSELVPKPAVSVPAEEGAIYIADEESENGIARRCRPKLVDYSSVYIDFNGPMSFFDGSWHDQLRELSTAGKVRGAFIMGGVLASEKPVTMPSIAGKLNRFSSATMNQLYHPKRTADFFAFLHSQKIASFIIVNNAVCDLITHDETGNRNFDGVNEFLSSNNLEGHFLREVTSAHYMSRYTPPRKPFDYYIAVALTALLRESGGPPCSEMLLFYSEVYGVALVSSSKTWEATIAAYKGCIDISIKEEESEFERCKKGSFRRELEVMDGLHVESIVVRTVVFAANEPRRRYKIELGA